MSIETWLWIVFGLNAAAYMYVGRNVMFRESWEMPRIFWSPTMRFIAAAIPLLGFLAISIAGFLWTEKGWWLLGGSIIAFFVLASRPMSRV